jgi:hypothetical protein
MKHKTKNKIKHSTEATMAKLVLNFKFVKLLFFFTQIENPRFKEKSLLYSKYAPLRFLTIRAQL